MDSGKDPKRNLRIPEDGGLITLVQFLLPVVQPPVMQLPVMQPPIACPQAIYLEVGGEEGESSTALKHSGKSQLAPAVASSALFLSH